MQCSGGSSSSKAQMYRFDKTVFVVRLLRLPFFHTLDVNFADFLRDILFSLRAFECLSLLPCI